MDLLSQYSDHEDDGSAVDENVLKTMRERVKPTAPEVDTATLALVDDKLVPRASTASYQDPGQKLVYHNPKFDELYAPVAGPAHPFRKDGVAAGLKNHTTGHVEDAHVDSTVFDEQYSTFHSFGYAVEPQTGTNIVGCTDGFKDHKGESVWTVRDKEYKRQRTTAEAKAKRAAQEEASRAAAEALANGEAWTLVSRAPWADKEPEANELTEEQAEHMKAYNEERENSGRRAKRRAREGEGAEVAAGEERSIFHGKEGTDYQGRSWVDPPRDKKKENDMVFLPKRWVHTWSGHTKGVNAIEFFPGSGHLLLSAGLDGKVKVWDVFNSGKCMRTYMGHSKSVRGIHFSNDGRRFLTASYDKNIKLWDTETGKVLGTYNTGKMAYVAKFHSEDDKQNVMMAGCSDKKIYQFDLDTGDVIQEYDQHLGAVNTVTFVDEGRRFVTTSDDKTIRVWEFGIPVVIKYIADPAMHSVPSVAVSPNKNWFIGQSLDNQIVTYSTKEKFRQNRKKVFKGHTVAGYACQVNFSPDSKYVLSGDAEGKCYFWDWKSTKLYRSIKAHDGVCIGCAWHPLETSKVATCGWDGLIKYWD
uniref:Pre-mRNA-processing factor 17 n=1 Tax=Tetraselmis sp. GSL018 TaxID=582737 RepID=A0A061R092_9CHLO|mmetsp:Transcript_7403/g.17784  ORF Transcript_7403/g.17784 Transcript_7403/m.17784 type:complete len:584 (+) Transcript_7403:135-1886(+)